MCTVSGLWDKYTTTLLNPIQPDSTENHFWVLVSTVSSEPAGTYPVAAITESVGDIED